MKPTCRFQQFEYCKRLPAQRSLCEVGNDGGFLRCSLIYLVLAPLGLEQ